MAVDGAAVYARKIAWDIVAKHLEPDFAFMQKALWNHSKSEQTLHHFEPSALTCALTMVASVADPLALYFINGTLPTFDDAALKADFEAAVLEVTTRASQGAADAEPNPMACAESGSGSAD